jgi:cytohesin
MLLAVLTVPFAPRWAVAQEAQEESPAAAEGPDIIRPVMDMNVRAVRAAIADGADVNAAEDGMPVLVYAALAGQTEIAAALIEAGANVNATGPGGATALMHAAGGGHLEIVQALIGAGADVNATDSSGWTALMRASFPGHTEVVRALTGAGANVNAADAIGGTALWMAEVNRHEETAAALREAGAS